MFNRVSNMMTQAALKWTGRAKESFLETALYDKDLSGLLAKVNEGKVTPEVKNKLLNPLTAKGLIEPVAEVGKIAGKKAVRQSIITIPNQLYGNGNTNDQQP